MKKKNKLLEILSFYTCVPQMTIIWCIVPEIRSATDKIFVILDNFLPIWKNEKNAWGYYYFTLMYHKWWSYDVWFLRYEVQRTEFFVILDHFLPFSTLRILKIKFKKNWKNAWRYHHFTQVCHKWQSYDARFLRYGEWQKEFFFLMVSFFPFYDTNNPKNQNFAKVKKMPGYQSFYHYAYTVPDIMESDGCNCYFSLWAIFCSFALRSEDTSHIARPKQGDLSCQIVTQILAIFMCIDIKIFKLCLF